MILQFDFVEPDGRFTRSNVCYNIVINNCCCSQHHSECFKRMSVQWFSKCSSRRPERKCQNRRQPLGLAASYFQKNPIDYRPTNMLTEAEQSVSGLFDGCNNCCRLRDFSLSFFFLINSVILYE